jgi:acetyl esterase/lipase
MNWRACLGLWLSFSFSLLHAEPEMLPLWPGHPPGWLANAKPEEVTPTGRIQGVSVPMLYRYAFPGKPTNATALIVFPGGGYHHLAINVHGDQAAARFASDGMAVFALKYRTNPPHKDVTTVALQDAQQAVRVVRQHAADWGIDPHRIGVLGYSAGSHLALSLAAQFEPDARPDFVAAMCPWAFGKTNSPFVFRKNSPPLFICHARDDKTAPLAMTEDMVKSLENLGVPVELHVSETGGHGAFHLDQKTDAGKWPDLFLVWLKARGLRK